MNGTEIRELDNVLETARLRSVHRLREALQIGAEPNPLDVLVVANYRDSVTMGHASGPWGRVKTYAPHWGAGAGGLGMAIALIEAIGKVLGR